MDLLLEKKRRQGLWRRHPELPELDSAIQYMILVDTSKIKREIRIREQKLEVGGEVNKEGLKAVKSSIDGEFATDPLFAMDNFHASGAPEALLDKGGRKGNS